MAPHVFFWNRISFFKAASAASGFASDLALTFATNLPLIWQRKFATVVASDLALDI